MSLYAVADAPCRSCRLASSRRPSSGGSATAKAAQKEQKRGARGDMAHLIRMRDRFAELLAMCQLFACDGEQAFAGDALQTFEAARA